MAKKILVIDDNQAVLNFLNVLLLQKNKYEVELLQDSTKAYKLLNKNIFDVVLLDMDMPDVTGLDILRYIVKNDCPVKAIVLTGVEDVDLAISAMKLGTYDYLIKPVNEEQLFTAIDSAIEDQEKLNKLSGEHSDQSHPDFKYKDAFRNIITHDDKMLKLFHVVEKFAETDNSILIWGESGSGKELFAEAIHKISSRRDKKFVAVNAGTFAQELFSSEFFGYEKGAFTGAAKDKAGFLEEANGGTLFLDEIGELNLPIQVKLLRVLQEEEFYRLGSTKNIKVDVRIIAATNKNLFEEIQKGNFRKDLFFRLNINSITISPLRDRKGDVELLANHFLHLFNSKYGKNVERISDKVLNCLKSYSFPGNVRELMNIINSAIIVEPTKELRKQSLPGYFIENNHTPDVFAITDEDDTPCSLSQIEKEHINNVLHFTNNNKTKAADILGISRVNLLAKIKKYNLGNN